MSPITGRMDLTNQPPPQLHAMTAAYPITRATTITWTADHGVALAHTSRAPYTAPAPRMPAHAGVAVTADVHLSNADDLHRHLTSRGVVLRTDRDDELILHAYLRCEANALTRLYGGFATAIWDSCTRRLLLARDRFGIKPLIYARLRGGGLTFASTTAALLAHPNVPAALDTDGLADLLLTSLSGIAAVPPGHLACLDDGRLTTGPWWQLPVRSHQHDDATTVTAFERILREAVTAQTTGRAAVAVATGAGVDSAFLAALAARHAHTRCTP